MRVMQTAVAPLRIGVIGVGRIGRLHAELISRQVEHAMVAAVYDPVQEAALAVQSSQTQSQEA